MLRSVRLLFFGLLPVLVLYLSGCGGSGSSTSDPLGTGTPASSNQADQTDPTMPVTAQDPVFSLDLSTDLKAPTETSMLPQVDANNGTVLLTAKLLNVAGGVYVDPVTNQKTEAGSPVPNQAVSFKVLAGPAGISYVTPLTDKNGEAKAVLATGNVLSTTNVIVEAAVTVEGRNYRGYTSFQIVRGTGVIMFTSLAETKPGYQTSMLPEQSKNVDPTATAWVSFLQLIPFKLTDANGNARSGVPVTLSVYSYTGDPDEVLINYLTSSAGEQSSQTVTTDAAGMGIFNTSITLTSPPLNSFTASSVVFKAVTNDPIPVTGYVGGSYSLTSAARPLTITPASAEFGSVSDLTFTIGGGASPFTVASSAPGRVAVSLAADGVTVTAHLADSSQWTGSVNVLVTDAAGQSATASITR